MEPHKRIYVIFSSIIGALTVLLITSAAFFWYTLKDMHVSLNQTATDQATLTQNVRDIEVILATLESESSALATILTEAAERSETLEDAFARVTDNVETLEKLTTTDEELLQKYSKIYFLNEHYVPEDLVTIPDEYVFTPTRTYRIHREVWPYLEDLLDTARSDGIDISIISAFRSFGEQAQLKGAYTVTYGAGSANQFSADQGYSEHQLGTTVDFTTASVGATFSGFAKTETYEWLTRNAHRFGFILSYPEGNTHYQFEPWHWRFVGTKLARELHQRDEYFYDIPQREINEYIVDLFE